MMSSVMAGTVLENNDLATFPAGAMLIHASSNEPDEEENNRNHRENWPYREENESGPVKARADKRNHGKRARILASRAFRKIRPSIPCNEEGLGVVHRFPPFLFKTNVSRNVPGGK